VHLIQEASHLRDMRLGDMVEQHRPIGLAGHREPGPQVTPQKRQRKRRPFVMASIASSGQRGIAATLDEGAGRGGRSGWPTRRT
jgi:hypothetical protein